MVADTLRVQMLGEFTLQYGCQEISDNDNRSRKVWLLLAYAAIGPSLRRIL